MIGKISLRKEVIAMELDVICDETCCGGSCGSGGGCC